MRAPPGLPGWSPRLNDHGEQASAASITLTVNADGGVHEIPLADVSLQPGGTRTPAWRPAGDALSWQEEGEGEARLQGGGFGFRVSGFPITFLPASCFLPPSACVKLLGMDGLEGRFELARQLAQQAGKLLADNLNADFRVAKKGAINLVTEMDLAAEKLILEGIRSRFPGDAVLSEEVGAKAGDADKRWIVDPLDGTTNYAHGYRFFCVSIAFEQQGEAVLGVVHDPITHETFAARKGQGALLNGLAMRVSEEDSLKDSLLCTGFPYDTDAIREGLELFSRVLMKSRAVRRDGSAALDLCYVAAGRFEGFWEKGLNSWDVAAGQLIVREAGGKVTDLQGGPMRLEQRQIVATNGKIHPALLAVLSGG